MQAKVPVGSCPSTIAVVNEYLSSCYQIVPCNRRQRWNERALMPTFAAHTTILRMGSFPIPVDVTSPAFLLSPSLSLPPSPSPLFSLLLWIHSVVHRVLSATTRASHPCLCHPTIWYRYCSAHTAALYASTSSPSSLAHGIASPCHRPQAIPCPAPLPSIHSTRSPRPDVSIVPSTCPCVVKHFRCTGGPGPELGPTRQRLASLLAIYSGHCCRKS